MKNKHPLKNQKPSGEAESSAAVETKQDGLDFAPSADEVARRAYFGYVNHGSLPGHDVQHWLKAEADLIAERQMTRIHALHHSNHQHQHQAPARNEEGLDL